MAKKEEKKKKIVLERTYNVPLRREYLKAPNWKRTPKAVRALKAFITKHTKSDNIRIGIYLNRFIWKDGIKNPPHHVKIDVKKDETGLVLAEIVGAPKEIEEEPKKPAIDKKTETKEGKKEGKKEKAKEKEGEVKKIEDRLEGKKEGETEKAKKIEKQEIKEMKKEHPKAHAPKAPPVAKNVEQHPTAPMGR